MLPTEKRTYLGNVSCLSWRHNLGENGPFEEETSTGNDSVAHVPADWAERVFLHHASKLAKLLHNLSGVDLVDKGKALAQAHVGPIDTLAVVGVIWENEVVEDVTLVGVHDGDVLGSDVVAGGIGAMRGSEPVVTERLDRFGHCVVCRIEEVLED